MKTLAILFTTLLLATASYAGKTITGDSNTFLDDYKLTQIDDNKFELSYANSTEKFTVEVCPKEKECCYMVRGENVEVMYLCNKMGMGLRKMPEASQSLSTDVYCKLVDCKAFKYQSLLTANKKKTKDALGIIACFFPSVINAESQNLVFNAVEDVEKKLMVQN